MLLPCFGTAMFSNKKDFNKYHAALGQLSAQLILRKDLFPADFADQSRKYLAGQFDRAMRIINTADSEVDKKWWIHISDAETIRYNEMFRQARIDLAMKAFTPRT